MTENSSQDRPLAMAAVVTLLYFVRENLNAFSDAFLTFSDAFILSVKVILFVVNTRVMYEFFLVILSPHPGSVLTSDTCM